MSAAAAQRADAVPISQQLTSADQRLSDLSAQHSAAVSQRADARSALRADRSDYHSQSEAYSLHFERGGRPEDAPPAPDKAAHDLRVAGFERAVEAAEARVRNIESAIEAAKARRDDLARQLLDLEELDCIAEIQRLVDQIGSPLARGIAANRLAQRDYGKEVRWSRFEHMYGTGSELLHQLQQVAWPTHPSVVRPSWLPTGPIVEPHTLRGVDEAEAELRAALQPGEAA